MAMTGTSVTVIKEFHYMPGGIQVRLTQGWEGDRPAYYAIEQKTGLNLDRLHRSYGRIESQVLGPSLENYKYATKRFAEIVRPML